MNSLVVIVNNEYEDDPRVTRAVSASCSEFQRITVLSGVPNFNEKRSSENGTITIIRYLFLKPHSSFSIIKKAFSWITSGSNPVRRETAVNLKPGKSKGNILRDAFSIAWLLYILFMNVLIFIRFFYLKADVYYANDFDSLLVGFLLSKLHHTKLIYDSHELYADLVPDSPVIYSFFLRKIEGFLARKASAVITVNKPIAEILRDRYHLRALPVVVYNCPYYQKVDVEDVVCVPPYKLLYHGIYMPGRNLEQLILSMSYLNDFHLFLRGYGVLESSLRQLVEDYNLMDKVTFLPPVKMQDLVKSAVGFDFGVLPFQGSHTLSLYYSTPNKTFEYMMAGLALAASDLPVLKDIVMTNGVGVLFDSSDPEKIALALKKVKPDDLAVMKRKSIATAQRLYNFEHESEKLVKVYQGIFNNGHLKG